MSQDRNNIVQLLHIKKRNSNTLSDQDKVVFSYHYFEQQNTEEAVKTLCTINQAYYTTQFHKDISRALLCHETYKITGDESLGKESEFYLVVYRLVRLITHNKLHFTGSGHFYQLKDELFKGLM